MSDRRRSRVDQRVVENVFGGDRDVDAAVGKVAEVLDECGDEREVRCVGSGSDTEPNPGLSGFGQREELGLEESYACEGRSFRRRVEVPVAWVYRLPSQLRL